LAAVSVAPNGGACTPAVSTVPPAIMQSLAGKTGVSLGTVNLGRGTGISMTAAGVTRTVRTDAGSAVFIRYPNLPASMLGTEYLYPENVCQINGYPGPNGGAVLNGTEAPIVPQTPVPLDAGQSIMVSGPSGTRAIMKRTVGMLFDYPGVTFGDTTPRNYFDP